ncbi:MAG: hypothetical protein Kow0090_00990 [Myxococcota bacterium]
MAEALFFYIFAILAVATALGVVFFRNVMYSAISVIGTMLMLAGLYILLKAHFLGIIQILVYAGAIIVLFLFVIQLLNQRDEDRAFTPRPILLLGGIAAGVFTGVMLVLAAYYYTPGKTSRISPWFGTVEEISRKLFRDYLLPFEFASILLLAAIVGAVVIAKRKA